MRLMPNAGQPHHRQIRRQTHTHGRIFVAQHATCRWIGLQQQRRTPQLAKYLFRRVAVEPPSFEHSVHHPRICLGKAARHKSHLRRVAHLAQRHRFGVSGNRDAYRGQFFPGRPPSSIRLQGSEEFQ